MLNLAGYQETETLYTGARTLVYRATRLCDDRSVIIKILRNAHPHFNELVQFRNQYVITQNVDSPYIVQPLTLERHHNSYALIMPDEGAVSLDIYWQGVGQNLKELLEIAIQLAEALHILAGQQIIHKDIKPANILIHPQTKQIQLIDFSIASLLPKEQRQLVNPSSLEGTLTYIAPEQTGRMNRGIDYRSDFYALGVTLYELLVGTVPFTNPDPLMLIHAHIAQPAMPPSQLVNAQGQLHPPTISALIMKLMAKNAEDRYQSAFGLKHDLERCLRSLDATGVLADFELGERDICDRFLIPEKLYGRENEVQVLLDAFERVSQGNGELLLVAGYSGVGKTAVVNEAHKPITEKQGYFIKGKYDQFQRNIPFSAFVQSFRDLMRQLLGESDTQLTQWKHKILQALGQNAQVIVDVIPELEQIIGQQPPVPQLEGSAAQNRFNLLFPKFVGVFANLEHPLTIFLDDLQWADSASLSLLKLLIGESDQGYLLVLGAYRDNEVFPAHPLMLTLEDIEKKNCTVTTLTLAPLDEIHINDLVADTLLCSTTVAQPLSELVYQKNQGNPFFSTQFLKGLHEDNWIIFEREAQCWQCDLTQVKQLALTDDVVEFMVGRLHKLSPKTQTVLKLAACIGNQFDLATLAVTCEGSQEKVAVDLWQALQEDFVIPENQTYKFFQGDQREIEDVEGIGVNYRFLHDRVQQAAYSLIPESQKQRTHYHIGQLLLQQISPTAREDRIFELVNQLNYGISLINQQDERDALAALNLTASRKAKASTAYQAARDYVDLGLSLLGDALWQRQYSMALDLHELGAEIAALLGDFDQMEALGNMAIEQAHSLPECISIYRIKIQANFSQNKLAEAIAIGQPLLQELGAALPDDPDDTSIQTAIQDVIELMGDRQIDELVQLPPMTDLNKLSIVQIANSIITATYVSGSPLFPLITSLSVKLSIQYGNAAFSAVSYAWYGVVLYNFLQDAERAKNFGLLARQIVADKPEAKASKPEIFDLLGAFILHRNAPIKDTLPILQEGYTSGLEVGNLEFAGHNAQDFCFNSFWCGQPLIALEQETHIYCDGLVQINQLTNANWCRIYWQSILNLLDSAEDPCQLSGNVLQETEFLPSLQAAEDLLGLFMFYLFKLKLCFLFGEIEQGQHHAIAGRESLTLVAGMVGEPAFLFYDSLIALAGGDCDAKQLKRVEENQTQLQENWARHAPMNHQHKVDLVAAEQCRVLGQKLAAIERYDQAIAGAKANGYLQEEALANECFAKFYLNWGRVKEAEAYMQTAYYCYARWEAKAKVKHLEANYPELLTPILQKQRIEFNAIDSLNSLTKTLTTTLQTQTQSSTTSLSDTLDFASVLQAAQKLSSTIQLEQLLSDIVRIVLTNAGAQKMALLTSDDAQWQLQALAEQMDECEIITQTQAQPLTPASPLPIRLIQYVKNTQEPLLLNETKTEITGILEGYLLKHQPQSVLCVPLLNQGNLVAIAYLEHPTTKGVFTRNRQTIIEFLCAQAAVALQNAQLYSQAQTALTDLQQAQLQLVQSEKMSALGNLVAGVAHEINNPVGFLQGNLKPAQDYVQDLLGLIDVYQTEYPQANENVEDEIEAIDLDFVREDLPKLIGSMNAGVDRIRNISDSLRTFSRKDQDHKIAFNIHDGIESTLLILKHRTKANEQRPPIQIFKNYGELPEVQCFAGQLNQVFMNILANAIDAFDEANQGKTYQEIEAHPNTITITTLEVNGQVEIKIQDNGCGMKPETVGRIFEQGFTTKDVGKGTGLGMAIAYQIITEKHGGTITCTSELGQGTTFTITLPIASAHQHP